MFRQMQEYNARLNEELAQLKTTFAKEKEHRAEEQKWNRAIIKAYLKERATLEEQNRITIEAH